MDGQSQHIHEIHHSYETEILAFPTEDVSL